MIDRVGDLALQPQALAALAAVIAARQREFELRAPFADARRGVDDRGLQGAGGEKQGSEGGECEAGHRRRAGEEVRVIVGPCTARIRPRSGGVR